MGVMAMTRGAVWSEKSLAVVATVCVLAAPAAAVTPATERVNVSSTGEQTPNFKPNCRRPPCTNASFGAAVSATGQFVAFTSSASNLVAGDTNGLEDVFVRDRVSGQTQRVSVSSTGAQANGVSVISGRFSPAAPSSAISPDGRFIVFSSTAPNLVAGDTNAHEDVFVRDLVSGQTERVSVSSAGRQGNGQSTGATVSPDGRLVSFGSEATTLVRGDTNGRTDGFVHNRSTGQTRRVTVSSTGAQANRDTNIEGMSADGRFVVFSTFATNLVRGDTNRRHDVFVRDRETRQTRLVSVSSTEAQAAGNSNNGAISANGRFVTFASNAANLVRGDTNGVADVFVRDRSTGQTRRVSVSSTGAQGNLGSRADAISASGRFVVFSSKASNLVADDTAESRMDVFVHDRATHQTHRVSVSSTGAQANQASGNGAISPDGSFVVFDSSASNLVEGDTNNVRDVFIRGPLQ
jgi:hypothetical protein